MNLRRQIGLLAGIPVVIILFVVPAPVTMELSSYKTLMVAILMALWWLTEALPIAVTALIPMVALPLLGVEKVGPVAQAYGDSTIFLFMGGFFIAMAMQKHKLHQRIALFIIRLIGLSPRRIILGFMIATAALSMWISNTATTMMMYPIGMAIILNLQEMLIEKDGDNASKIKNFQTTLMLAIAYAASIGGIGTLIGTPPNIIFASMLKSIFPNSPDIGFVRWMGIGVPVVVIFLPITWVLLTRVLLPVHLNAVPGGMEVVQTKSNELGKMQPGERGTLFVFLLTASGWIFRQDLDLGCFKLPGWAGILGVNTYVDDGVVAIFAAILLFMIPVHLKKGEFLLDWESAIKIPWGILILFGGGIALANAFRTSGLAQWIGSRLELISDFPLILMILAICLLLTFLTEVTSNTAIATLFMPIMAAIALGMSVNPLLLMIPAVISASCAFMLPVATPPNAIIFASGLVTVPQMARCGLVLNLVGAVIITMLIYLVAIPVFGIQLGLLPLWAN